MKLGNSVKRLLRLITFGLLIIAAFACDDSIEDTSGVPPSYLAFHDVYYSLDANFPLEANIVTMGNMITNFMSGYKKYLKGYATTLYYVPTQNYGTCPAAPDPSTITPPALRSASQWATYLQTMEGSNNYTSAPDCSKRHVFYCGSLLDNWPGGSFISGPALGKIGSPTLGIALVFWDDINFDLKTSPPSGQCMIAEDVVFGVALHELIHLYTTGTWGNNHCANQECIMHVSADYDTRWNPFKSSNFPYLCDTHATLLYQYENRSAYAFCNN